MNANQLIETSRSHNSIEHVAVESAAAARELVTALKSAWVGETDSVVSGSLIEVWGWDETTSDGQQEWRVHISH